MLSKISNKIYVLVVLVLGIEYFVPHVFYGNGIVGLFTYGTLMGAIIVVEFLKYISRNDRT